MAGGGKKTNLTHICVRSWEEKLPDYQIIEWNEDNLDIDSIALNNRFFRECRNRKLWAYMADYLRLYILYEYGGIYLDTDVQVLRSFDDLLKHHAFLGYEAYGVYLGTGIIAAEPKNEGIKRLLDFYDKEIWEVDFYTIPFVLKYVMGKDPKSFEAIKVFPEDYFSPYDYRKEFSNSMLSENTYSIHWYDGSWKNNKQVSVFLQTKSIRNPVMKKIIQAKKLAGYYIRKVKAFI